MADNQVDQSLNPFGTELRGHYERMQRIQQLPEFQQLPEDKQMLVRQRYFQRAVLPTMRKYNAAPEAYSAVFQDFTAADNARLAANSSAANQNVVKQAANTPEVYTLGHGYNKVLDMLGVSKDSSMRAFESQEDMERRTEGHPIVRGINNVAAGLTTPGNLALLAGMGPAAEGIGAGAKAVGLVKNAATATRFAQAATSGYFSYDMLHGAVQSIPRFEEAYNNEQEARKRGDAVAAEHFRNQWQQIGVESGLGTVMGVAAGLHMKTEGKSAFTGMSTPDEAKMLQAHGIDPASLKGHLDAVQELITRMRQKQALPGESQYQARESNQSQVTAADKARKTNVGKRPAVRQPMPTEGPVAEQAAPAPEQQNTVPVPKNPINQTPSEPTEPQRLNPTASGRTVRPTGEAPVPLGKAADQQVLSNEPKVTDQRAAYATKDADAKVAAAKTDYKAAYQQRQNLEAILEKHENALAYGTKKGLLSADEATDLRNRIENLHDRETTAFRTIGQYGDKEAVDKLSGDVMRQGVLRKAQAQIYARHIESDVTAEKLRQELAQTKDPQRIDEIHRQLGDVRGTGGYRVVPRVTRPEVIELAKQTRDKLLQEHEVVKQQLAESPNDVQLQKQNQRFEQLLWKRDANGYKTPRTVLPDTAWSRPAVETRFVEPVPGGPKDKSGKPLYSVRSTNFPEGTHPELTLDTYKALTGAKGNYFMKRLTVDQERRMREAAQNGQSSVDAMRRQIVRENLAMQAKKLAEEGERLTAKAEAMRKARGMDKADLKRAQAEAAAHATEDAVRTARQQAATPVLPEPKKTEAVAKPVEAPKAPEPQATPANATRITEAKLAPSAPITSGHADVRAKYMAFENSIKRVVGNENFIRQVRTWVRERVDLSEEDQAKLYAESLGQYLQNLSTNPEKPLAGIYENIDPYGKTAHISVAERDRIKAERAAAKTPAAQKPVPAAEAKPQTQQPAPAPQQEKISSTDRGAQLLEQIQQNPVAKQLFEKRNELDAREADDKEYRSLLSTGSKDRLKKGETWRKRVNAYIRMSLEKPQEAKPEAPAKPTPMPSKTMESPVVKQTESKPAPVNLKMGSFEQEKAWGDKWRSAFEGEHNRKPTREEYYDALQRREKYPDRPVQAYVKPNDAHMEALRNSLGKEPSVADQMAARWTYGGTPVQDATPKIPARPVEEGTTPRMASNPAGLSSGVLDRITQNLTRRDWGYTIDAMGQKTKQKYVTEDGLMRAGLTEQQAKTQLDAWRNEGLIDKNGWFMLKKGPMSGAERAEKQAAKQAYKDSVGERNRQRDLNMLQHNPPVRVPQGGLEEITSAIRERIMDMGMDITGEDGQLDQTVRNYRDKALNAYKTALDAKDPLALAKVLNKIRGKAPAGLPEGGKPYINENGEVVWPGGKDYTNTNSAEIEAFKAQHSDFMNRGKELDTPRNGLDFALDLAQKRLASQATQEAAAVMARKAIEDSKTGAVFVGHDMGLAWIHDPSTGSTIAMEATDAADPNAVMAKVADHRVRYNSLKGLPEGSTGWLKNKLADLPHTMRSVVQRLPEPLQKSLLMDSEKAAQILSVHIDPTLREFGERFARIVAQTGSQMDKDASGKPLMGATYKDAIAIRAMGKMERTILSYTGQLTMNEVAAHEIGHFVYDTMRDNGFNPADPKLRTQVDKMFRNAVNDITDRYEAVGGFKSPESRNAELFAHQFMAYYRGEAGMDKLMTGLLKQYLPEDLASHAESMHGMGQAFDPPAQQIRVGDMLYNQSLGYPNHGLPQTNPIKLISGQVFNNLDMADQTKAVMRKNMGAFARDHYALHEKFAEFEKMFNNYSTSDLARWMDAAENKPGNAGFQNPLEARVANLLGRTLDDYRDQIRALGTGKFDHYIENYFAHLFEGPTKRTTGILQNMIATKRLPNSSDFLLKRTHEFMSDALQAGLKPVTNNPVTMQLLRLESMAKYLEAHRIKADLQAIGGIQWFKNSDRGQGNIPADWVRLDEAIFNPKFISAQEKALAQSGAYWAHPDAGKYINNYLSPGLRKEGWFNMVREYGNTLNMAQLGMSLFHLTFEGMTSSVSDFATGLEAGINSKGLDRLKALKYMGRAAVPFASAYHYYKLGSMLRSEYMDRGSNPQMSALADAYEYADGRMGQDPFYVNNAYKQFRKAMNDSLSAASAGQPLTAAAYGFKAAVKGFQTPFETLAKPLMENFVPRVKAGAFASLAQLRLEQLAKDGVTDHLQIVHELGKISDSIDNRLGQVVYDNLFWNKTAKDLGMLAFRSFGWNLGDVREIAGGGVDLGRSIVKAGRGEGVKISSRTAFMIALPIIAGTYGAMYGALTGNPPKEGLDYFFPRTGKLDSSGNPERVVLPSYMRDVFGVSHAPGESLVHKLHPMFQQLADLYTNRDFYGTEIAHDDDSWADRQFQRGKYLLKQYEPITFSNMHERMASGLTSPAEAAISSLGVAPAPKWVGQTPGEDYYYRQSLKHIETGPNTQANFDRRQAFVKIRNQFNAGVLSNDDLNAALKRGDVTPDQLDTLYNEANMSPIERHFSRLKADEAIEGWKYLNANEKALLKPHLVDKMNQIPSYLPEQQGDLYRKFSEALK